MIYRLLTIFWSYNSSPFATFWLKMSVAPLLSLLLLIRFTEVSGRIPVPIIICQPGDPGCCDPKNPDQNCDKPASQPPPVFKLDRAVYEKKPQEEIDRLKTELAAWVLQQSQQKPTGRRGPATIPCQPDEPNCCNPNNPDSRCYVPPVPLPGFQSGNIPAARQLSNVLLERRRKRQSA